MSDYHTGNVQPAIDNEEHEHCLNPPTKRVLIYGYDGSSKNVVKVNSEGELVINTEPSGTGINGAPVTVGTTPIELTFTGTTKVISIKADSTNTGRIWFGPSSVDSTGTNAYGELTADSAVEIELDDTSSAIYVCASVAAQKVYKAALT